MAISSATVVASITFAAITAHARITRAADASAASDLTTVAETSDFARTGRFDEVQALCAAFPRRFPGRARCFSFGRSPEGRPLLALAVSADGTLTAAAARRKQRPVLLFVGGIHAGEIDGKDAGFLVLRERLRHKGKDAALAAATVLFVPVFNVDGHERFAPNQRPNQRGPAETGFRTTAQNLNLNRDWTKAEAPEMAAMLGLVREWDPTLFVDLHVTDGAKFEHDVALLFAPDEPTPAALSAAAHAMGTTLLPRLAAAGHLPLAFYPFFRKDDDPSSGFDASPLSPRYSHRYFAARNRLGVLVETHSWRPYPHRVRTTRAVIEGLLDLAAVDAVAWRRAGLDADAEGARLGGTRTAITWKADATARTIDFRGYAYTRAPSDVSGATFIQYDESKPQIWKVPLYDHFVPALEIEAPRGGYVVPAAHATWVGHKLDLHGIRYETISRARADAPTSTFRADKATFTPKPFEGRHAVKLEGQWRPEARPIAAGSLFVPIAQSRALLAMHLLDPRAPDSLAAWGFFSAAFERKEMMDDYVTEAEARRMLAADERLRAEFAKLLSRDAAFAKDPERRLEFFRRRHPTWDDQVDLYPVLEVDQRP
jgi:hypothetical protein